MSLKEKEGGCWGLLISMENGEHLSLEQVQAFLTGNEEIGFKASNRKELYAWTQQTLCAQSYTALYEWPTIRTERPYTSQIAYLGSVTATQGDNDEPSTCDLQTPRRKALSARLHRLERWKSNWTMSSSVLIGGRRKQDGLLRSAPAKDLPMFNPGGAQQTGGSSSAMRCWSCFRWKTHWEPGARLPHQRSFGNAGRSGIRCAVDQFTLPRYLSSHASTARDRSGRSWLTSCGVSSTMWRLSAGDVPSIRNIGSCA